MNWIGCYTLWRKEVARFGKVWLQTIGAPVLTALLYQLIFAHAVGRHAAPLPDIAYTVFLMPGLAMMSMTQNAFANTSSSLMQSRLTGNLVFILLPPLSPAALFLAYTGAAWVRGMMVGLGVLLAVLPFGLPLPQHPVSPLLSAGISTAFALAACTIAYTLLRTGWKLRNS